jgi:hypothetical protein
MATDSPPDDPAGNVAQPPAGSSRSARAYRRWRDGLEPDVAWSPDAISGEVDAEYHGPHVTRRRAGCESIGWRSMHDRHPKIRVLSHTCECLATFYELCSRGGSYFIRRTVRGPDDRKVTVSPDLPRKRAEDLWWRLLQGLAR